ncbi:hypothetical protein ACF0H5_022371 [Mactra antiquata]
MMTSPDIDVIKDIPGYKVILKTVLKNQIQLLVEQLYLHGEEETVLLTANLHDGSLSHLGSESGKTFLDNHEDMKSQFLGFCLERHHTGIDKRKNARSSLLGYSPDFSHTLKPHHGTRNIISSESRVRNSPYHRDKVSSPRSLLTHTAVSTTEANKTVPDRIDNTLSIDRIMNGAETEHLKHSDMGLDSDQPLDLNTSNDKTNYNQPQTVSQNLDTDVNQSGSYSDKSVPVRNDCNQSSIIGTNIKTEPEDDSDIEVLTEFGHTEGSDNSWVMKSSSSITFKPETVSSSAMNSSLSEYTNSRTWESSPSTVSTVSAFDPSRICGTSTSSSSVGYSFKKRFIGRQNSEQSKSSLHQQHGDKHSSLKPSQSWTEQTSNHGDAYVPICDESDNLCALQCDDSHLSQIHDLSIKQEKVSDNDNHTVSASFMYENKQRKYKPVSHLTEAQRQRRRFMDRERQRRRRERVRAANLLGFYQMYRY